jgi:hypothetical protein
MAADLISLLFIAATINNQCKCQYLTKSNGFFRHCPFSIAAVIIPCGIIMHYCHRMPTTWHTSLFTSAPLYTTTSRSGKSRVDLSGYPVWNHDNLRLAIVFTTSGGRGARRQTSGKEVQGPRPKASRFQTWNPDNFDLPRWVKVVRVLER